VTDWGGKVAAWFGAVCVAAGTGALLVWPASTAARQPSRGWLLVLFITLTAIAAAAFIVMLITGPLAVWSAWRKRKVRGLPTRKIRECDPYLLGVKRSAGVDPPVAGLPTYIARDHDPELRKAIRDMSVKGGFIVLVGEPGSGKSRSAYEAVRAALPAWDLVHARLPTDLAQAAKENAPRRVIWLDDMSRLLDTQHEGLAADFAGLLGSRKPVLILGMLWPTSHDRYTGRHTATGAGDANVLLPVPSAAKEVLDLARVVLVQVALSNSEQERAEEAARHDKQISAALPTTDFGLFQTLAGAPVLLQRWLSGLASGRAVITAAVDARLLGATEPLTREFLVQAAPGYLLRAEFARLTPRWEDEALGYATGLVDGACTALPPVPGKAPGTITGYGPAGYLLREGQERRRFARIPERTWRALLAHVTDSPSLTRIGWSAEWRLLYELAHEFYKAAGTDGATRHARLLIHQGKAEEAREILSSMAAHGDQDALWQLSQLAKEITDPAERIASMRSLATASAKAATDLGHELESQGLTGEAIATWSALAKNGDAKAASRAARLLSAAGRDDDAIILLRSCSGSDSNARSMLADLLIRSGRTDDAETVLRTWAEEGDSLAASRLAQLVSEENRGDDLAAMAEAGNEVARNILLTEWIGGASKRDDLAEKAIAASGRWGGGDPWSRLHVLCELGRTDQALDLMLSWEQEHGPNDDLNAIISSTLLKAGRTSELRARADSGDSRAQELIAGQLADQHDLDALADQANRGHYAAYYHLSKLLVGAGRIDDAIALWNQAVSAGHDFARRELINILRENSRSHDLVALLENEPVSCGKYVGRVLASALVSTGQIPRLKDRADAGDKYADEVLAGYLDGAGHWDALRERATAGSGAATRLLLYDGSSVPEQHDISNFGLRPDGSIAIPSRAGDAQIWTS
jgi:tetratricopeptide (TPR) repeat protein